MYTILETVASPCTAVALRVMSLGQSVSDAIKAKRLHDQLLPNTVSVEGNKINDIVVKSLSVVYNHLSFPQTAFLVVRSNSFPN